MLYKLLQTAASEEFAPLDLFCYSKRTSGVAALWEGVVAKLIQEHLSRAESYVDKCARRSLRRHCSSFNTRIH
jgi:hypothetical protein